MNKNHNQIKIKVYKDGIVTDSDFNTWLYAYNVYADYVNSNIDVWNYEHEKHYSSVSYEKFYRSKTSELLNILYMKTGMRFAVDDGLNFIGKTKSGGKIYFA